jgi:predicted metal-dependent HD superfamily phosphohydrolase
MIGREYSHYPRDAYCNGRVAVLTKLIEGGCYATPLFRDMLRNNSELNVAREIESLKLEYESIK